jgi:hypothetical protein
MYSVDYDEGAIRDYLDRVRWLRKQQVAQKVISDFVSEIEGLEADISADGNRFPVIDGSRAKGDAIYKAEPTRKHKYSLIFILEGKKAYILAVAAPERRPGYWLKRVIKP